MAFAGIEKFTEIKYLEFMMCSGIKKLPNVLALLPKLEIIDLTGNYYSPGTTIEVEKDLWEKLKKNGGNIEVICPNGVSLDLSNQDKFTGNNDRFSLAINRLAGENKKLRELLVRCANLMQLFCNCNDKYERQIFVLQLSSIQAEINSL